MNINKRKYNHVLAIAPTTRGFGFAVLDYAETLIDWGVKSVEGEKNAGALIKVEKILAHCLPDVVVMEDCAAKSCRRSARIRNLCEEVIVLARNRGIKVVLYSREKVLGAFFEDGDGTKYTVAAILSKRFPDELGTRLPPKRKLWMSEDYRMDIFAAVALALVFHLRRKNKRSEATETEGLNV